MSKITYANKNTGDQVTATEFNQIKTVVNANDDGLISSVLEIENKVDKDGSKVLSDVNFTTAKDTKLSGIDTGATANESNAYLLDRDNHTGTQAMSTIEGLQSALNGLKLPLNSRIGFNGDSLMAEGYVKNGTIIYYNSNAFAGWPMLYSNHKFKIPVNGIIATPGDTSGNTLNKLGAALALKLDVVFVLIGTNDIGLNSTPQSIISNLDNIYSAHISNGTKVIAIPILPRFAPNALTTQQEANRVEVNNWILQRSGITILDLNNQLVSSDFYDGLHLNKTGGKKLGKAAGQILTSLASDGNIADIVGNDTNILTNGIQLSGVDGFISGGSGQLASSFNTSIYNIVGANVVLSKQVQNYKNTQVISITGNYTGDGDLTLAQDKTTSLAINEVLEGFIDFEIENDTVGLKTINLIVYVYDGSSNIVQAGESLSTAGNNIEVSFEQGRYQMRTPQILLDNGTPAMVRMNLKIVAHEVSTESPINAVIKIHKIGVKKV